jgi:hypothetical protein
MPIRINLLAEAQAAEEMRRRDPVKRAIWIGAFFVAVVLIGALSLQLKISAVRSDITTLAGGWKSIETQVKDIEVKRAATRELELKVSAIEQFTTNRLLWASVLNGLQRSVVDSVQLVRFKAEQTYVINEAVKGRTNTTGVISGKPASATEKIVVSLDGRDFSARPADQVPHFKDSLLNAPFIAENLQKTNKIQLTSLSAPQFEGARAFVGFGLQLFFQEKERNLHE